MNNRYIRENKNSYNIVKSSKIFAKVKSLDDAMFVRDLLVKYDWDLDKIPQIIEHEGNYLILEVIDEKLYLLAKYKSPPSDNVIDRLVRKFKRNPNNSKYGLNISKIYDTFIIKKRIFGEDYEFGYYDNLEDAQFVRNFLLDNEWNVAKFQKIEFDDETDTYKVVHVVDDIVYVLASFNSKDEIDLNKVYEDFLAKISKHKYGLSDSPYLDPLKDKIESLEEEFNVKTKDSVWSFDDLRDDASALNEIIFTLTPFQQSVFDAIDGETSLSDIEKALIRYRTKNFENKILKNINELISRGLVEETSPNVYEKTNL